MATANQNVTTTVTNQTALPQWYQDYLTKTLTDAQNVAATPYQAYTGPRVAGANDDMNTSYQRIQNLAGSATPYLNQATDLYKGLGSLNQDTLGAISGYTSAAQSAGQDQYGQAQGLFNDAGARDTASSYQPYGQQASNLTYGAGQQAQPLINQSTNPMGLAAAQPYLNNASGSFPDAASSYMSPYTDSVVNRIADLGARNLQEKLLPGINDTFIRSGQFGGSNNRDLVGRAIRDTQESVLGQQAQALEQGYGQAGQLYESDAQRQAGLAGTAGGLGTAQQQALYQAGSGLGNLGLGQANQISNIGQFGTQSQAADAARQLAAAQGISGIGQNQQQQSLQLANLASNAQQSDYARQIAAMQAGAQGLTNVATTGTDLASKQIGLQNAAGLQQQGLQQKSLDTAYQDFVDQRDYNKNQVGFESNVVHGLPVNTTTNNTTTGPANVNQLQPNTGSQVAGLLTAGLNLSRGGPVRRMADGGLVSVGRLPTGVSLKKMPVKRGPRLHKTNMNGLGSFPTLAA